MSIFDLHPSEVRGRLALLERQHKVPASEAFSLPPKPIDATRVSTNSDKIHVKQLYVQAKLHLNEVVSRGQADWYECSCWWYLTFSLTFYWLGKVSEKLQSDVTETVGYLKDAVAMVLTRC